MDRYNYFGRCQQLEVAHLLVGRPIGRFDILNQSQRRFQVVQVQVHLKVATSTDWIPTSVGIASYRLASAVLCKNQLTDIFFINEFLVSLESGKRAESNDAVNNSELQP